MPLGDMATLRTSVFCSFFTAVVMLFRYASMNNLWEGNPMMQDPFYETICEFFQGDTFVSEGDVLMLGYRNAVNSVWNLPVAYIINDGLADSKSEILTAIDMISRQTCISFRPRKKEIDYLHFSPAIGCGSYVGRIGGEQQLFINSNCKQGTIVHELMHSLGFHHEHMRSDRDESIIIVYENIIPERLSNFNMFDGNTLGLAYDTGSIMHYGPRFFSRNGNDTIITKNGKPIGQRSQLSDLDIQRLQLLYKCDMENASLAGPTVMVKTTTTDLEDASTTVSTTRTSKPKIATPAFVTAQSTPAPVTAQSTPAPVTPQSTPAQVTAQSTPAPVTAQSTPAPVTTQSTPAPVTAQSTPAPVTAQSTPAPVTAQSTPAPVTPQSTPAQVTAQSTPAPVTAQSTPAPVTAQSTPAQVTPQSTPAQVTAQSTPAPDLISEAPVGTRDPSPKSLKRI